MTAGDFGKNIKGLAEIFGKEVAAESLLQAIDDTLDAVTRTGQRIIMTGIGDDDIVVGKGWNISCFIDGLLQILNARAILGANRH